MPRSKTRKSELHMQMNARIVLTGHHEGILELTLKSQEMHFYQLYASC